MGHLMTQIDGPFSTMDHIKSMKIEHLDRYLVILIGYDSTHQAYR